MAGIRVNSGALRIEVNDNGDTIAIRKDLNFINNIKAFAEGLGVLQKEYDTKVASLNPEDFEAHLDLLYNAHKELHDGLEALFGEGTCRKVFGDGEVDVIPTMDAVADFCEQITPYIIKVAEAIKGTSKTKPTVAVTSDTSTGAFSALRKKLDNGDGSNEV